MCDKFSTFGDFYTDVWMTQHICLFVLDHNKRIPMSWKLQLMNKLYQAKLDILSNRQKVSVLGVFVKIFHIILATSTLMFSDSTHL